MKTPQLSSPVSLTHASLFAAFIAALPLTLTAQTWTGATNAGWGTGTNWTAAPAFDTSTDLLFNTSAVTNALTTINANRIARSITFGADVDAPVVIGYREFISSGAARTLTLQANTGNASITVNSGSTGAITMGANPVDATVGTLILGSNLDIVHNGSGVLLFNRPTTGGGFTITKSGTGTWQVNNNINAIGTINIDAGTMVGNTSGTGDIGGATNLNLRGGTLELQTGGGAGVDKAYSTVNVNVTSASTLIYNNLAATTRNVTFSGTPTFSLGADLTIRNTSADTSLVNGVNISRAITGTGKIIVEGYNNINSSANVYTLGRVLLSGDNSGWSGDLVISKGTVSLGGNAVNAAGTGTIVIGTTADMFGAGLTFFPGGANTTTATYNNNVIVRSGGFRSIKGSNTDHNIAFTNGVTLEGNLNIDHTLSSVRTMSFSGNITGVGGLDITRAGGSAGTLVRLSGANDYTGATTVATGAALLVDGSLTSSISVASGARFGGDGSTTGNLSFASGALFIFSPTASFDVTGTVSLDNSFSIASLVNADGSAIDWSVVSSGVYSLIGTTTSDFSNIGNFGVANAADLGNGMTGYFQNGSLELVVTAIPEPGSFALVGGLAAMGLVGLRRRQRSV